MGHQHFCPSKLLRNYRDALSPPGIPHLEPSGSSSTLVFAAFCDFDGIFSAWFFGMV